MRFAIAVILLGFSGFDITGGVAQEYDDQPIMVSPPPPPVDGVPRHLAVARNERMLTKAADERGRSTAIYASYEEPSPLRLVPVDSTATPRPMAFEPYAAPLSYNSYRSIPSMSYAPNVSYASAGQCGYPRTTSLRAPADSRPQLPASSPIPGKYVVGQGLLGQPKLFVPGQPLRNALRFLTP